MIGTLVDVVLDDTADTALITDASPGATSLTVEDVAGFTAAGGRLLLDGDRPLTYLETTPGGQVTLDAPLTTGALTGATVTPLDRRGRPIGERQALVLLDDDDRAQPATIPSGMVPNFPLGDALAGSLIEVELDHGLWRVTSQPDQEPQVDSDFIATPKTKGRLQADQPIATGGANWQTLTGFEVVAPSEDITFEPGTGSWVFQRAGDYLCLLAALFALNPAGNRGLRAIIDRVGGTSEGTSTTRIPTSLDQVVGIQHFTADRFEVGDKIRFQASQNSGDDVNMVGTFTKVTITRTAT